MTADAPTSREAYDLAHAADNKIAAHEDLCAERYLAINKSLTVIMGLLKWAGGSMFTIIMALLSWSLFQLYTANADQRTASNVKIELLQEQIRTERLNARPVAQPPIGAPEHP